MPQRGHSLEGRGFWGGLQCSYCQHFTQMLTSLQDCQAQVPLNFVPNPQL